MVYLLLTYNRFFTSLMAPFVHFSFCQTAHIYDKVMIAYFSSLSCNSIYNMYRSIPQPDLKPSYVRDLKNITCHVNNLNLKNVTAVVSRRKERLFSVVSYKGSAFSTKVKM